MLRKRTSKTRWPSFPAHVHGVSAMVFARPITIPTLCKSIIERETYDHFSSLCVCVACALDPLLLSCCSYLLPFAFLLSSFPRLSLCYSQLHTRATYAAACNQRSFLTSDFVSHPLLSSCAFLRLFFSMSHLNIRPSSSLVSVTLAST